MPKEPLSVFHEHLLLFLQNHLRVKRRCEGWDESSDSEVRSYSDLLTHSMRSETPLCLQDILDKYRYLFERRGPVHLEHKILEAFPEQEMKRLGLPLIRMVRGLDRLYCKRAPSLVSRIHPAFSYLPSLKKAALAKPLYSLYRDWPLSKDAVVSIRPFESSIAHEIGQQLSASLGVSVKKDSLREDLSLEISGNKIIEKVKGRTSQHTMGLHFLDCGVYLKSYRSSMLADLESESLYSWLEPFFPTISDTTSYRQERRFFLSSFSSEVGVFVYLHALFKSLEWDKKEIDLCTTDPEPLLTYFESRRALGKPVLERSYGIREIIFLPESKTIPIASTGKTVRIVSADSLSEANLRRCMLLSEDFACVSGDEGVVNAISANKGFFYDPALLSCSFVKDLIALAENKISAHRSTLAILRLFTKLYAQERPFSEGEWMDEIFVQCEEKMELLEIAEKIGLYLQDPDALVGFKKLNRLIAKEHSCNAFLQHLVHRAVCHSRFPEIASREEEALTRFLRNEMPIGHLVEHVQDAIEPHRPKYGEKES